MVVEPLSEEDGSPVEDEIPSIVGGTDRVTIPQLGLVEAVSLEEKAIQSVDVVTALVDVDSDESGHGSVVIWLVLALLFLFPLGQKSLS